MKPYRARYTPEAARYIRTLHPQVKQDVREAVRTLLETPLQGHALHHELSGYRSYRVRTYRIIYQLTEKDRTVDVIFVGPRRNVYEELLALVRSPSLKN
jgi:addiction module RelE/StbE family toxin